GLSDVAGVRAAMRCGRRARCGHDAAACPGQGAGRQQMTLLQTENLCKAFGSLEVTRNVDLVVREGERHVIIGPNGAGKTSLVHQLTGTLRPTSGRILFKGMDITGSAPETICQLGVGRTFQKNTLFRSLTVEENVRQIGRASFKERAECVGA